MLTLEQRQKIYKVNEDITGYEPEMQNFIKAFREFFKLLGEDGNRDGLKETPYRFAKAMLEYTEGYQEDPKEHLKKTFDVNHKEMIIVRDIHFNSLCEHHLAPFYGKAHIGYVPNEKITGLSKIARMLEGYAKRLQVQERLTTQVVEAMFNELNAQGVMVVIDAKHYCMCGRGVKKSESSTVTSAVRGVFEKPEVRSEFLRLIK